MRYEAGAPRAAPQRSLWLRVLELMAGLGLWGLAIALMVKSELGLGPWDAFHVGLHLQTGLSIGMASIATGAVIIVVTLAMRVRPGVSIVVNTLLIGVFVDLLLPVVPAAANAGIGLVYFAVALGLAGLATGLYIGAGFGQGPRDTLMLAVHERTGWSVQLARTLMEAAVLAAGWLMGGRVGVGTVLYAVAIGPAVQWGLRRFVGPMTSPSDDDSSNDPGVTGRVRRAA